MTQISKFRKIPIGCGAFATAVFGSLTQSVSAGGGSGCPCKPSPRMTTPLPLELPPTRNNAPSGRG